MLTQLHVPNSLGEAIACLQRPGAGSVKVLGGGTEMMPGVNAGTEAAEELVSLRRTGLRGIDVAGGHAVIGAATTLAALGADDRLAQLAPVVRSIAAPPVRSLATVGGNLFVTQPYGDLAVALLALDARVDIAGPSGTRGAGVAEVLEAGVAPEEIVTAVRFAVPPTRDWFFRKAARRRLNSAAVVTVAARIERAPGAATVRAARIALGGVGERPIRAIAAEEALAGRPLDQAAVAAAAEAALTAARPFTDAYASAWYRARVLPVHFRRALLGE